MLHSYSIFLMLSSELQILKKPEIKGSQVIQITF